MYCYYGHTVLDMWWRTSAHVRIYCMYMHILHFYPHFCGRDRRKLYENIQFYILEITIEKVYGISYIYSYDIKRSQLCINIFYPRYYVPLIGT